MPREQCLEMAKAVAQRQSLEPQYWLVKQVAVVRVRPWDSPQQLQLVVKDLAQPPGVEWLAGKKSQDSLLKNISISISIQVSLQVSFLEYPREKRIFGG